MGPLFIFSTNGIEQNRLNNQIKALCEQDKTIHWLKEKQQLMITLARYTHNFSLEMKASNKVIHIFGTLWNQGRLLKENNNINNKHNNSCIQ